MAAAAASGMGFCCNPNGHHHIFLYSHPHPPPQSSLLPFTTKIGITLLTFNQSSSSTPPPFMVMVAQSSRTRSLEDKRQAARTERLWQLFFWDPSQWWDKRFDKGYPDAPDFKHKTTEKALWINDRFSPSWLHAKLATLKSQPPHQSSSSSSSSSSSIECGGDVEICVHTCTAVRMDQLWQELFSNPSQWWDNRFIKKSPKYPDFKCKFTHEGLWIESWLTPPWVKEKLASVALDRIQSGGLRSWMPISLCNGDDVSKLCQEGPFEEALHMVELIVQQNTKAPINAYAALLKGCARRKALPEGKRVHALVVQSALDSNIFLGKTLVDMYSKCDSVLDARKVFNTMPEHNVFSWTAIISAYADHGQGEEAINLFQKMQQTGIAPDKVAFVVILKACASIAALKQGKEFHSIIIERGYHSDVIVGSALVDMYAKCGCIEYARRVFDKMSERNVVSWSAMIAGYAQNGLNKEAVALYEQMKQEGVQPNNVTYVILLQACASIAVLEQGKHLHSDIIKGGFESHVIVASGLVDMYAKCGCIERARQVFNKISERDVVLWTTMIEGYAQQGLGKEALTLLEQMQREGTKPNEVTYLSVLSACSHSGLVDEGRRIFDSMCKDHGVTRTMEHYACVVDLLGRAGRLADAEDFIKKMPIQPNAVVWMTLLGAARNHGHEEIGKRAFDHVMKLEPENTAAYVLLSNIYAAAGRMDKVSKMRNNLKDVDVKKMPACSWIEVDDQVHAFF